jgi:hypothetical protein
MKQIRVFFEDFGEVNPNQNFITDVLQKDYQVIIDPNAEYLFFSTYGFKHYNRKYDNCIKIFYSYENVEPDFSICDYAIAFQHLTAGDRYLRYPWYLFTGFDKLEKNKVIKRDLLLNRKFCNFVYGDFLMADPYRKRFFEKLCKYKRVDSGGSYMNNIGRNITYDIKLPFIQEYKFTLAIENSSLSGYTTEKIVQPMTVNSMPIYWGNRDVGLDFNKKSFVCIHDFHSDEEAIEEIIRLDNDDDAYMEKISQPWYSGDDFDVRESGLRSFFKNIFDQPIEQARRRAQYGWVRVNRTKMEAVQWSWPVLRKFMKIRNVINKRNLRK